MSGQSIGTVVGGAIGFVVSGFNPAGAMWGASIGGTIGGIVDPVTLKGPHIGEGQTQSATDGTPIAWVMGTMWVAGTIVDVGERREVKKKSGGKGGKPKTTTYEAHQDFAILVCESDEIKGSTISNVLAVEQDGKIVYDVRPGSAIASDSDKFIQNVTFYYGDEAQLPPALVETIHGVGQNPAYRGVLLAAFSDFNLTPAGDRIPSFRFLVSSVGIAPISATSTWRYAIFDPVGGPYTTPTGILTDGYDDSSWASGAMPFGHMRDTTSGQSVANAAHAYNPNFPNNINTEVPLNTRVWARRKINVSQLPSGPVTFIGYFDNGFQMWINGTQYVNRSVSTNGGFTTTVPASAFRIGSNTLVCAMDDQTTIDGTNFNSSYFDMEMPGIDTSLMLDAVVEKVCTRGGVAEIDVSDFTTTPVLGYPVASQVSASGALQPLLGAYFAYSSEYDARLNFHLLGADAVMTINEDDLVDTGDAPVSQAIRGNATEYPRRIVGQYYDPDQNYMTATVMASRRASGITATGDQSFQIPVVMRADKAQQAVDKALKVAYAQLDGTQDITVPFATASNCYLRLVPGDAVIFLGQRFLVTSETIGLGTLTLKLTADRQSAYTSDVQAIPGRTPTAPQSRYSGPTAIIPMSLPQLQSQDPYGVYVVTYSNPHDQNWRSAAIQMSLDDGATWQDVGTSNVDGNVGTLTAADGGTTLVAQMTDDLSSVTSAQLDAGQNAAVLIHGGGWEVLQFGTVAEDDTTPHLYTLTDLRRAQVGTTQLAGVIGDKLVLLDAAQVIPIDTGFTGKTIKFRAVGNGETPDDATVASVVYQPDTTTIISGGTFGDGLT